MKEEYLYPKQSWGDGVVTGYECFATKQWWEGSVDNWFITSQLANT